MPARGSDFWPDTNLAPAGRSPPPLSSSTLTAPVALHFEGFGEPFGGFSYFLWAQQLITLHAGFFLLPENRNHPFSRQIVKRPFSQCPTVWNSALWNPLGHLGGDGGSVDGEGDEYDWGGNRDKTPGPLAQLYTAFFIWSACGILMTEGFQIFNVYLNQMNDSIIPSEVYPLYSALKDFVMI